jgi:general stress protein CsbA
MEIEKGDTNNGSRCRRKNHVVTCYNLISFTSNGLNYTSTKIILTIDWNQTTGYLFLTTMVMMNERTTKMWMREIDLM